MVASYYNVGCTCDFGCDALFFFFQIESEALRIVSYIGLAISLACLLLTIIFFISFGSVPSCHHARDSIVSHLSLAILPVCVCVLYSKKLFAAVHNFVHLNLAIALFCGYLVFAVGVELANHEKVYTSINYIIYSIIG